MKPCFFIILTITSMSQQAFAVPMSPKSGELRFTATATGALKINGTGAAPEGKLDITEGKDKLEISGNLKIKLETLSTGLSLRDSHMKDKYLEAGKFPEALLILSKQSLPRSGAGSFEGELVLRGVKHKVSGTAEAVMEAGGARVKASFPVRLEDHGIPKPSFAGITVANEVAVETEFQATTQN